MLIKANTSLNDLADRFTIELQEVMNPYVAESFVDAPVEEIEVTCDPGGTLYVSIVLGGAGVAVARAKKEDEAHVAALVEQGVPEEEAQKQVAEERAAQVEREKVIAESKLPKAVATVEAEREKRRTAVGAGVTQVPPVPSLPSEKEASVGKDLSKDLGKKEEDKQPIGAGAGVRQSVKEPPKHK